MKFFKKIYLVLLIGLGMYAVGYIFGEWLATGRLICLI
ncbi:hypothetical protein SSUD12_0723 [Streptococcus suis D12]|uniref:Uncharacterized protein n=1 Tax=Streptococcus suis D12 TaxID=1004952 RepID=G7SDW6_STRSU|nr:hypothetical protein SSUD12_0723 [Streptococcus suis D12]